MLPAPKSPAMLHTSCLDAYTGAGDGIPLFHGARDLRFASRRVLEREVSWQHRRIGGVSAEFRESIENGSPCGGFD